MMLERLGDPVALRRGVWRGRELGEPAEVCLLLCFQDVLKTLRYKDIYTFKRKKMLLKTLKVMLAACIRGLQKLVLRSW